MGTYESIGDWCLEISLLVIFVCVSTNLSYVALFQKLNCCNNFLRDHVRFINRKKLKKQKIKNSVIIIQHLKGYECVTVTRFQYFLY